MLNSHPRPAVLNWLPLVAGFCTVDQLHAQATLTPAQRTAIADTIGAN